MRKLETISELRAHLDTIRRAGKQVGLVPTMGAIHEGHRSLMRAARADCDELVVSIFVNPTQFGPGEDYEQYPRPLDRDLAACRQERVDTVLTSWLLKSTARFRRVFVRCFLDIHPQIM